MARARQLSEQTKRRILALRANGYLQRQIAVELGVSMASVSKVIKNEGAAAKTRSGRPRKISLRTERRIIRMASNSTASSKELKARLGLTCSSRTVRRCLNKCPFLVWRKKQMVCMMNERHAAARFQWALERFLFLPIQWQHYIFSDEKKFNLDGPDGNRWYYWDKRTESQVFMRRQNGGGTVMVWGAIGWNGKTAINFIDGRMNSERYCNLLENALLPIAHEIALMPYIFQQDNASVHVSRNTKNYLAARNINVSPWPAKSPDLNPIENIWASMSRRVYTGNRQYNNVAELRMAIVQAWADIQQEEIRNLFLSIPRRLAEVIARDG